MFTTINPKNNTIINQYNVMNKDEAFEVLSKTNDAFKSWKKLSIKQRLEYLKNVASVLRKNKEEYAEIMTNEMGKIITESLGEVEKCAWLIDELVIHGEKWLKDEHLEVNGEDHIMTYEPLGPLYLIMPWNYPFWQVFKVAIPPLVAGNTIVLKHSENVTGSALAIERAFEEANVPQDILRVVLVDHDTSEQIIHNDTIKAVSLTGSVRAGSVVASQAGSAIKKIVLELGGSDPFIICEDAHIDLAVEGAVKGRVGNCGQVCIGAKRFIIHENVADEFAEKFVKALKTKSIGDPLDKSTQIGPMVNLKAVDEMVEFVEDATQKGATLLYGGEKVGNNGAYFKPAVLTNVTRDMRVFKEETFGPIAPIITFSTIDEAIELANDSEFGLNSSVWSKNLETATTIAKKLETGGVFINNFSVSHPHIPLGGIKNSGFGRELSKYGIKEFTNLKPINVYKGRE